MRNHDPANPGIPDASSCLLLPVAVLILSARPVVAQNKPLGHLVIVGGGGSPDSAMQETIRLAGGGDKKIVVIASASTRKTAGGELIHFFENLGATNTELLNINDETVALGQLKNANLIWMGGGSQLRLVMSLAPKVKVRIAELYLGGSVIGGTSAGAAAMSRKMITGQADLQWILAQITELADGLGLTNAIVDQHIHIRQRFNRLLSAVLDNTNLLGIGIDEKTAILISGWTIKVVGESSVLILDASKSATTKPKTGQHYSTTDVNLHVLTAGQRCAATTLRLVDSKNN